MTNHFRYLCIAILFFSVSNINDLEAQLLEYIPFPTDTAKWTQTVNLQGFEPGMDYTERGMDYYILGDTSINGQIYQKLYFKETFRVTDTVGWYITNPLFFIGRLREEEKKVFFLYLTDYKPSRDYSFFQFTKGEEYLLYDYNIEVGDALHWMVPEGSVVTGHGPTNVVRAIDTIEVADNDFRQKFIFLDSLWYISDIFWIPGIGSSQGLFGPYNTSLGDVNDPRIVCFNDNNQSVLFEDKTRFEEATLSLIHISEPTRPY